MTLDAPLVDALTAIVDAPQAWSKWTDLEASNPGAAAELVRLGLAERWDRPDYPVVTLSPWGADRFAGLTGREPVELVDRGVTKIPVWAEAGGRAPARADRRQRGEVPLLYPELVIDGPHGPEYLVDERSGEPVAFFCGEDGRGQGVPVVRDRRLKPAG